MRDKNGNSYVSRMVLSELAIDTPLSWEDHLPRVKDACSKCECEAHNPELMLSLGIVNLNILTGPHIQACKMAGTDEELDARVTRLETLQRIVFAGIGITFMRRIAIQGNPVFIVCYFHYQHPVAL